MNYLYKINNACKLVQIKTLIMAKAILLGVKVELVNSLS